MRLGAYRIRHSRLEPLLRKPRRTRINSVRVARGSNESREVLPCSTAPYSTHGSHTVLDNLDRAVVAFPHGIAHGTHPLPPFMPFSANDVSRRIANFVPARPNDIVPGGAGVRCVDAHGVWEIQA